jgi:hypothetical protein
MDGAEYFYYFFFFLDLLVYLNVERHEVRY